MLLAQLIQVQYQQSKNGQFSIPPFTWTIGHMTRNIATITFWAREKIWS